MTSQEYPEYIHPDMGIGLFDPILFDPGDATVFFLSDVRNARENCLYRWYA